MFIHLTTSSDGDQSSNFRCLWKEYDHMIFVHHIFCNVCAVWCPFWFKVPQYVRHLNECLVFIWLEIIKEWLAYLHTLSKEALTLVSFPCMVRKDQWLSCCLFHCVLEKHKICTCWDLLPRVWLLYAMFQVRRELYLALTPVQRLSVARHPNRPTFLDHVLNITDKVVLMP